MATREFPNPAPRGQFGRQMETLSIDFDACSVKLPVGIHHCSIPCDHCDHLKHLLPVSTVSFTQRGRI